MREERPYQAEGLGTLALYELRAGERNPRLLKGDIAYKEPRSLTLTHVVSPDGGYAVLGGQYMINLRTLEGNDLKTGSVGVAFSPDSKKLALAYADVGVWIVSIGTGEGKQIYDKRCESYSGCESRVCLYIGSPFWLDTETILFWSAKSEWPQVLFNSCGPYGSRNAVARVVRTDGSFIASASLSRIKEKIPKKEVVHRPVGPTIIADIDDGPTSWFHGADLAKGIFQPYALPDIGRHVFLSPNGDLLLDFPKQVINLRNGNTTALGFGRRKVSAGCDCVWAPDGERIACMFRTRDEENMLIVFSVSGDEVSFLPAEHYDRSGSTKWDLLAWTQ